MNEFLGRNLGPRDDGSPPSRTQVFFPRSIVLVTSPSANLPHQIVRNSLSMVFRFGAQGLVFLLVTPYFLHQLGTVEFGLWSLIYVIVNYATLFDLGISGALARYCAGLDPRRDAAKIRSFFTAAAASLALLVSLVVGGLMVVARLGAMRAPQGQRILSLGPYIIPLLAVSLAANLVSYALMGIQRQDLASYAMATFTAASGIGGAVVLAAGFRLKGLILFTALSTASMGLTAWKLFSSRVEGRFVRKIDLSRMKELLQFGVPLQLYALASLFYIFWGKLLIAYSLSLVAVAHYELGLRLVMIVKQGLTSLASPSMPGAARFRQENHDARAAGLYFSTLKYISLLGLPLFAALYFFSDSVIRIWVGDGYADTARVLQILVPGFYAWTLSGATWFFLVGYGIPHWGGALAVLEAGIGTCAMTILLKSFGLTGGAFGVIVAPLLTAPVYMVMYHRKVKFPVWRLLWEGILYPVILCGVLGALALRLSARMGSVTAQLLSIVAYVLISYAAFVAFGVFGKRDQRAAGEWVRAEWKSLMAGGSS